MRIFSGILILFNFGVCTLYAQNSAESNNEADDIKFYVYTRSNANHAFPIEPDVESIIRSFYQAWKPTVVSIHRLGGSLYSPENQAVVTAKLQQQDCNIIVVDWGHKSPNASNGNEFAINANVAKSITDLLLVLQTNFAVQLSHVHLIGFSEGAHIAGLVGRNLFTHTNLQVQRITGLDPAGGIYSTAAAAAAASTNECLRADDAYFVEVLHTNAGELGLRTPLGHVDYYLNGGVQQPGCATDNADLCAHERAYELLHEMWSEQNNFLAQKCSSVIHMSRESCVWVNVRMGESDNAQISGLYYVETNGAYPYGKGSFVYAFM